MKASYADVRIVRYNYIFNYSVSNYIKICKIDEKQYTAIFQSSLLS